MTVTNCEYPPKLIELLKLAKSQLPDDLPWKDVEHHLVQWWEDMRGGISNIHVAPLREIFEKARQYQHQPQERVIAVRNTPSVRLIDRLEAIVEHFEQRPEIHGFRSQIGRPAFYVDDEVSLTDPTKSRLRRRKPFTSKEACAWLQKQIDRDRNRIAEDDASTEFQKLMLDTRRRMRTSMRTVPLFMPDWKELIVPARKEGNRWRVCPPGRGRPLIVRRAYGSSLDQLANVVDLLKRATPFDEPIIVWWILTGVPPKLPSIRVLEKVRQFSTIGGKLTFSWIETQIFAPDLTLTEYRNTYRHIRREWSQAVGQPIKKKHAAIFTAVQKRGLPPSRYDKPYWMKIREDVIRKTEQADFISARACAQQYWRIKDAASRPATRKRRVRR
jgi:hypothetical protein